MLFFKTKHGIIDNETDNHYENGERIMWAELQTMQMTYQEITQGVRPWNALGDFMNYFFGYASDRREGLVKDPIQEPANSTPEMHRWAVFCAASVEYLSDRYNLPCPEWVHNPAYQALPEPWYEALGGDKPRIQARLRQETPEPFSKRNIFCGSKVFANKYELAALTTNGHDAHSIIAQ
jgi:hypothetical protein